MGKSISEKDLTYVNVARSLPGTQFLFAISEFILERNLTNVKIVIRPLAGAHTLFNIIEFILE